MQLAHSSPGSHLALVQLPGRMRRALKLFRRITGLTAVTSVATSLPETGEPPALLPPLHPRCARRLRSVPSAPCRAQWLVHARSVRRSPRTRSHTCPIGLRCSCVPIHFGDHLVGVAKLVVDAGTPEPTLRTALSVLKILVSGTCQESAVAVMAEEVRVLRQRLTEMQRIHSGTGSRAGNARAGDTAHGTVAADARGAALVERALAHLQRHHMDPALSLRSVATALGCNPRYLTTRFTQIVGERMHTCLVSLRAEHACRLLVSTDLPVKEIAYATGFSGAGRLANAFRTHVGVSPGEYRRIFAHP